MIFQTLVFCFAILISRLTPVDEERYHGVVALGSFHETQIERNGPLERVH